VEEGQWNLEDGTPIEAVTYTSTTTDENNDWSPDARAYQNVYSSPVVVGQVMSYNDSRWSTFWECDGVRTEMPDSLNLATGKHVAEDTVVARTDEIIGYIVINGTHGTINGIEFEALVTGDTVRGIGNGPPFNEGFNSPFGTTPTIAVVTNAEMDGGNGGWAVVYGASPFTTTQIGLAMDEDQIADSERNHATDPIAVIAFNQSGSYVYNDPPEIMNPQFNETDVELQEDVMFNVTVEDKQGNDSVVNVKATLVYPDMSKTNLSMTQLTDPNSTWEYEITDATQVGTYNISDIFAFDSMDTNHTTYSLLHFNVTDTTPPIFTYIANITINLGLPLGVDFDAVDPSPIHTWTVNNTINFTINNTGYFENASALSEMEYWLNITVNDTYGNLAWEIIYVNVTTVPDTTLPWFDPVPENQTAEYNFSFSYDIDAKDDSGIIDTYWVNDTTNFIMDPDTGLLQNNTLLALGNHSINISVNDSSGNVNWTIIVVYVNDTTAPFFSPPLQNQTIEYGDSFSYDIDAIDYVAVDSYDVNDSNDFIINSGTGLLQNKTLLQRGVYWLNISVNDTFGNLNWSTIKVTVQDTTPPATVSGLGETDISHTWLLWNWTNPTDADFDHVEVWVNGSFYDNVSVNYSNITGRIPGTVYEIQTKTADSYGNVNTTWINDTAQTIVDYPPSIQQYSPENNSIDPALYRLLNLSAADAESSTFCLEIYGSATTPGEEDMLYKNCSYQNNSLIQYNWSAPLLSHDANVEALWHFDNRGEYGENGAYVHDFASETTNQSISCSSNCPTYVDDCKFGGCYYYDGVDDVLPLSTSYFTDIISVMGIQLWIKPDDLAGTHIIYEVGGGTNGMGLRLNGQVLEFTTRDNSVQNTITVDYTDTTEWHFVTAYYNQDNMTMFLDGVQVNTTMCAYVGNEISSHNDGGLGDEMNANPFGGGNPYSGLIDEVRFLNYAPSPAQVLADYELGYGSTYYWYANAADPFSTTQSGTWEFTMQNGTISWNESNIHLGVVEIEYGNLTGNVSIISSGPSPNIQVVCDSGNCSRITDSFADGTNLADGETAVVNFTCENQTKGVLSAIFNITSDQDNTPEQLTVECEFLPDNYVIWNQTSLDLGTGTQNKGNLTSTAIINSSEVNNQVNVSCSSGNCSTIAHNWTNGTDMVDKEWIVVKFECSDNTPGSFSADFEVVSIEDPTPNTITVDCFMIDPPPGIVTGLGEDSTGKDWLLWNWTNPSDPDFDHVEVWINSTFYDNVSLNYTNVTGLSTNTTYEIQTITVDAAGNTNTTWINDTATTLQNLLPDVTLNTPANRSMFTVNVFEKTLNVTIEDDDDEFFCAEIFGGNQTILSDTHLLYRECNVANRSSIAYNWSSPVRQDTAEIECLYHFDNRSEYGENSTQINDFGGNCNDATCSGANCPSFDTTAGKFAGAHYYGGNDYWELGATSVFDDIYTDKTVELWFKADNVAGASFRTIYEEGGGTNGQAIYVYDSMVFVGAWLNEPAGTRYWLNFTTTANEWHYLAMIFDGTNEFTMVYDGQNKSIPLPETMLSHTGDNRLGGSGGGRDHLGNALAAGEYFTGYIDEFVVYWETAISVEESIDNYKQNNGTWYWFVNVTDGYDEVQTGLWQYAIGETYQVFYGNVTGDVLLGSGSDVLLDYGKTTGRLVFAADYDSVFDFADLQAIGRKKDNTLSTDDFSELDSILGISDNSDNIEATWSIDGSNPKKIRPITINGRLVDSVSIINSTNSSTFITGILWDMNDSADDEYDASEREDIVFVTEYNASQTGMYGKYGYEIKVPGVFGNYNGTNDQVLLYAELE